MAVALLGGTMAALLRGRGGRRLMRGEGYAARWERSYWTVRRLRCLVREVDDGCCAERATLLGGRGATRRYDGEVDDGSCAATWEWSYWAVRRLRCWVGEVDDGCCAARWDDGCAASWERWTTVHALLVGTKAPLL